MPLRSRSERLWLLSDPRFCPLRVYFENRAGRVSDHSAGYARLTYHSAARTPDELRALLGHVTRLLAQYAHGRLLVDQRLMQPFSPADQQVLQQWIPEAVAASRYRFGAILQAHDVFARLATGTAIARSREVNLTYRHFDDEPAAVDWLLAQT